MSRILFLDIDGVLDVTGIAIVDDDSDMAHLAPWHVRTHFDRGLTSWECGLLAHVMAGPTPAKMPTARTLSEALADAGYVDLPEPEAMGKRRVRRVMDGADMGVMSAHEAWAWLKSQTKEGART